MREVLALRRKVLGVEHEQYAASLGNLAHLLGLLGKDEQVAPLYEEALAITRKAQGEQHSDVGLALNNLGVLHFRRKDYQKAADYLQQALAIYERTIGPLHPEYARTASNLGRSYVYQGNHAAAARYLKLALSARTETLGKNHPDRAISLAQMSEFYRDMGQFEQALALQREAVEVALYNLDLAAAAQSERQQLALVNRHRMRLDELVSLAIHEPKLGPDTYDLALAFKGRVLAGQRLLRVAANRPDLLPVMDELRTAASRLATLSFAAPSPDKAAAWKLQIAELSEQKESLERRLSAASSEFRKAKKAPTLADLRATLPPDAALVDLLVVWHQTIDWFGFGSPLEELQVVAYVVRDKGPPKFVELGPYRPIEAAIDTWRESYGQSEAGRKAGEFLREKLWKPLLPHLEGAEYVLLSPEENLGRLAFAGLPGKEPGTYLIEEHKLAVIPAPQTLIELTSERPANQPEKNLLVVAGVDYDNRLAPMGVRPKRLFATRRAVRDDQGDPFQPLAGTEGELATIQKLYRDNFGPDGLTALEATGALQDAVVRKAPQHLYLHLATHGYFAAPRFKSALDRSTRASDVADDKLQSDQSLSGYHPGLLAGLALAGANHPTDEDDGILTAEEVGSLNLAGVQLVVLSACETGLGKNAGGEGLLGLQRAFQAAGARTVIGSLWKVPDTATRDLMERFYDNLWTKEMGKLEALREAQLWMLRERGPRGLTRIEMDTAGRRPSDCRPIIGPRLS